MTSAQIVDAVLLGIAAILPIILILRWSAVGLLFGVLVAWAGLALTGVVLGLLDPQRDAAMLDTLWLYLGWLGGLVYCVPIYVLMRWMRKKRQAELTADSL